MPNINQAGFSLGVVNFDNAMTSNHLDYEQCFLTNCSGDAIGELNACVVGFDSMMSNMNNLYSATSQYLHKANYNINLCEANNASMGGDN